ncbi:MAG: hypothetical protein HYS52_01605 [Candidatus Wildermuthbacteria bacterium]|nr:hypothetical protein [Candidatus Wildermuthbacteria bacterium]
MCDKAARFLTRHRETHGFISNHCAGAAAALMGVGALLGNDVYRIHAQKLVALILRHQSSEGWFLEYEGPDPGYETLGISYLSSYYRDTKDPDVLNAVRRSVEFFAYCVHPDGTIGGSYGSRNTEIFYPAGLEAFGGDIPLALSVCRAMRASLALGDSADPETMDDENFIPLLCNYAQTLSEEATDETSETPLLPCQFEDKTRYFPHSKIFIRSTRAYYCLCNGAKGGAVKVFAKQPGVLRWDDGGYAGKTAQGILCTTQIFDPRAAAHYNQGTLTISPRFFQFPAALPTPFKFLVLRLFSLTLFRSIVLGNIVKGMLVDLLITKKRAVGASLDRTIRTTETTVEIHDTLTKDPSVCFEWLECGRRFSAIHMGSARYFQPSQLCHIPTRPFPLEEFNKRSTVRVSHTVLFS